MTDLGKFDISIRFLCWFADECRHVLKGSLMNSCCIQESFFCKICATAIDIPCTYFLKAPGLYGTIFNMYLT